MVSPSWGRGKARRGGNGGFWGGGLPEEPGTMWKRTFRAEEEGEQFLEA